MWFLLSSLAQCLSPFHVAIIKHPDPNRINRHLSSVVPYARNSKIKALESGVWCDVHVAGGKGKEEITPSIRLLLGTRSIPGGRNLLGLLKTLPLNDFVLMTPDL